MEPNIHSIPTQFSEVQVFRRHDSKAYQVRFPEVVSQSYRYRNFTTLPISIGWRNGLKVRIPAEPTLDELVFVAIVEIVLNPDATQDAQRSLATLSAELSPEIKAMREALQLQVLGNKHQGATIVLEYPLTQESLQAAGGTVYLSELDIVVSVLDPTLMPPHPYSEEGKRTQTVAGTPLAQGGVGFGYAIEIVDNRRRYGDRYINIGGSVYKVSPTVDYERRDGVYVISNYAADGELERQAKQVRRVSFSQAQELLGLYRTYDEALHLGDVSQARKAELLTMEHQLVLARTELQQLKAKNDQADAIRQEEVAKLEGENERLKGRNQLLERDMEIERQKNKDAAETRSQSRKDTSETIKILPTIILGVATVVGTILGFFLGSKPSSA